MTKHFDYFVIGAGSGGVRSARIAAAHGAKVGVAEAGPLGGTCVNLGCVPKKLMVYSASYQASFEDARGYGWDVPKDIPFSWEKLIGNKNNEIKRLNGIYKKLLDGSGVETINGFARFINENTLDVGGETVTADKILIAVGGTPRRINKPGGEHVITSDEFFHWPNAPKRAVIIGGGYIAVEFANILNGLGAHVTLMYRGELFLRGFDHDIREGLAEEMRKQGIDLRFNCDVEKVEKNGPIYSIHTTTGDILECDLPIAAIGRDPKTDGLGLDQAGINTAANGQIIINDQYQTSADNVFALGDVANQHNLTPVAIKEGHVLADRLFGGMTDERVNYDNIATAVFSSPPLSTVGLTEEQARERGFDIDVYKSGFRAMIFTMAERDQRALMKLIVDKKTDKVIGMHMMGMDSPELMQGFAVAMNCGATKADFDRTMAMHPTIAEEFVTMRTPSS
jgi:glutathione reductase (NADPH)